MYVSKIMWHSVAGRRTLVSSHTRFKQMRPYQDHVTQCCRQTYSGFLPYKIQTNATVARSCHTVLQADVLWFPPIQGSNKCDRTKIMSHNVAGRRTTVSSYTRFKQMRPYQDHVTECCRQTYSGFLPYKVQTNATVPGVTFTRLLDT